MSHLAVGPWDIREFGRVHLPEAVATLHATETFAKRHDPPLRVLDMPVLLPGGDFAIPPSLVQFEEAINIAAIRETTLSKAPLQYVYITVDQKPVPPGVTQRREGWHSDAYLVDSHGRQQDITAPLQTPGMVERTYIAYDTLPTVFASGPWDLTAPNDCDVVLREFNEQAQWMVLVQYPPFELVGLDPYCVHNGVANNETVSVPRTFIKIQFSIHQYNREGNTHNDLLDYSWPMVPRNPARREHRYTDVK